MDVLTVLAEVVDSSVSCSEIVEKTLITKAASPASSIDSRPAA